MILILFARSRIPNWPLSPVGPAIGIPYPVFHTWFLFLLHGLQNINYEILRYKSLFKSKVLFTW